MISTRDPLVPSLVLLVLLGVAQAGPFPPRSNGTTSRLPPRPGGRTAGPGGGGSSPKLYEHTVEGGEKQVVFTHRINLPSSANCGCPPGAEPPAPASEVQALRVKVEALEELVKGLKEQCHGGCCPAAAQAGTGQTDVRSLCSRHGVFDLGRCACSCEPGWTGPTCSDPTGVSTCPDDCNDQGRCVEGRCVCFEGYTGPSCSWPTCPGDCRGRGRCVQGVCVCRAGFTGEDCGTRVCPKGCSKRGQCKDGKCMCDSGYSGEDCGVRSCPQDCNQRGRCEDGKCVCDPGYSGEDCGVKSCPRGCNQRGRCENGRCVCDPGYSGEDCGGRSCPWDCGDGGRCVSGRCVCWPGYSGEDCSSRTCPRDCHGRGHCEDGECICEPGYSGDDCGVRSCPQNCNQRGHCEDGRCVCWPGYTGDDCGSRACPRDCRGRGRCENGACVCNAGFSGVDCGVRSCPGDCLGRGRCENGRCLCWPGYTGKNCGTRTCPGDCRGRGRCQDGRCVCEPGYTGDDCGIRRCPGDCRGRGRCEDGVCVCDRDYTGEDCGQRSCPGDCRGRGQCQDGFCVCDTGYTGEDCGTRSCPQDCNHQGVCHDGVCDCWEGFTGEACNLRTCPGNCNLRGRCENGRCVCAPGYTGPSCSTRTCPGDCRGRGRCVQGVCVCQEGYSGEDCGQEGPLPGSCFGGCGPRELCRAGQCVCVEGFEGPDCATRTCPGACRGRGSCQEGSCVCHEGYAGEDCGEEIPPITGMRMHLLEETTVRTEWTRASGPVDAYEIRFTPTTEGLGRPFSARVPSSTLAYDQRGLSPGQEYQVTVRALRGSSWGPPTSQTITTMIDGPQDLRVTAVTPTTMELSWLRPQAEVDRFVVSYVSAGNQRVHLDVAPEEDRTLLTELMPGVEYVVTVTAERGRAVSYPASVRANTAPAHHNYQDTRPPAPPPRPPAPRSPPRSQPRPGPRPDLDPRPPRPMEEEDPKPREVPLGLPPPRFLRNLTSKLGPSWASVQDVERYLRASGYPLRGNQTYTSVARSIYTYLQRRAMGLPAPPSSLSHKPRTSGNLDPDTRKPNSARIIHGHNPEGVDQVEGKHYPLLPSLLPGPSPRHPKPEVLGTSADGALLVSLDGLRGQFEQVVLRWQPLSPMEGPSGELAVPGATRTARLPGLRPSTTYHVEVHGVQDGQASKSYAFITTTGPFGATDEPPIGLTPPPTTQGARAPILQLPANESKKLSVPPRLGELQALGMSPNFVILHWTVPEGQFDSFLVQYQDKNGQPQAVPVEGLQHDVTISSLDPGHKYKFNLYGLVGENQHGPLTAEAKTPSFPHSGTLPRLGELWVTDPTSNSLHLSWTVPEGQFDSFLIQYKDRDGQMQMVPVEGPERSITISPLNPSRRYKFILYGLIGKKRHGPLSAEGTTAPQWEEDTPPATESPKPRLGELTVTDVTHNSLHLLWTIHEGRFDSFVVQYKDKDGQTQVVPVEVGQNEVTISDLQPSRKYKMNLYGLRGKQRVGPISAIATTDPLSVEPHLGEVTVTDVTRDSLRLSWTVTEGKFDSFEVQYKDRNGQPQVVSTEGIQDEVTISGLEHSRKYKFLLFGIKDGKRHGPISVEAKTDSPKASGIKVTPRPLKPRLGEKLTAVAVANAAVHLSWTVQQGSFDSFVVQYKDKDGQPQMVPVEGEQNEVVISGLEPNRKYKMLLYGLYSGKQLGPLSTVVMTGPRGEETSVPTSPTTDISQLPAKPHLGELMVTDATSDSLHLSWTIPEGQFESFVIQYKNGDGQTNVVHVEGDQNTAVISGLEPDHKYKMNLYGLHDGQHVGPSSIVGVTALYEGVKEVPAPTVPTTEAPEPPEKPHLGELTVTGATPDSLKLSWTNSQGKFDAFSIQYKDRNGRPQAVRVEGNQNEVTVSDLEPDHRYKMNLYGFHDGQRIGPVSVIGVTAPEEETPTHTASTTESPEPPFKPRLGELTVIDSTPDSLRLSWSVPEGQFDFFVIQYKNGDGQPKTKRVRGDQNEVTISGLEPDYKYKMNLYGLHNRQRIGPVSVIGITAPERDEEMTPTPTVLSTEPPPKPRLGELIVIDATSDSLDLSWTVPEGQFDSFVLQFENRDGQPKVVNIGGQEDTVIISGLEPDHTYKMNLYGFHDGHRVGPISTTGVTAPRDAAPAVPATEAPEPPEKPELGELTVTEATPDSLKLSWTISQGEFDYFTIQYKDTDGRPQIRRVEGDQNEITFFGLEPEHRYKMNLYGFHDGQRVGPVSVIGLTAPHEEETPAPTVPATEPPEPPEKPELEELTVTEATPDSLKLSWTISQGEFDYFTVQYKDTDGRPQIVRVQGDQNEVVISELEPDHRYKMNLYGYHDGQRVGPVSITGKTVPYEEETPVPTVPATEPPEPPEKPELEELTVTEATPDSLKLFWTISQGEFDYFTIQYKDTDGRPQIVRVEGDQNEVTISELEPDHRYKMNLYGYHDGQRVGPVSVTGKTAPHEEETPATEAPEPPEKPELGELTVTEATPDSLKLSWTISQGEFDYFTIQYKDTDGRPQIIRVEGDQNEVTISELEPDHRYKMNLYGFHNGQRVGPVSVIGKTAPHEEETPATEAPEPPEKPELGELTVTEATPDSLKLSWTISQGEFDYFTIQYKDTDGRPQIIRVEGDQNEVTISELEPDNRYKMNLYGFHNGQRVGPVSVTGKTVPHEEETPAPTMPATEAPEPPEKPELGELTVTDATPDSLKLSWTISQGEFDYFTIQYKDTNGRPQIVRVGGDQNEVTISELEPDHRYKMNLYGYHDGQRVGPVSVTGKTVPHEEETPAPTMPATEAPEPPEKPELGELTVTDATPDSLKLSWTISQGEFDYFTIQYKDSDGRPQIVRVGGDQKEVTISELEPDHRYKMNLYGYHDGQRVGPVSVTSKTARHEEEIPAPTMSATEAPEPPEKPELGELTVTEATPDFLKLSWTISQGEFDYFTIQYKDTDGRPQIVRVGGDQNEVSISELEPDHKYKMNLYGYHDGQRVGPVSVTGKTAPHEEETPIPTVPATEAPEPPEKPELGELTVTGATPDSLKLSWTISQGEFDYFTIQYKDTDGRPQIVRVEGDQNEVTISELEPDHRYKMNLYGYHDGQRIGPVSVTGKTAAYEEETPATEAPEPPEKPELGELTVTEATPDSLKLFWTISQGEFDYFTIQYKDTDGRPQIVRVEGDQNEVTISELEPDHRYKMNLYGYHDGQRVGPVSVTGKTAPHEEETPIPTVPATEAPEPPEKPELGELTVTDATPDSLKLFWTISQGEFDYFTIQYKDTNGRPQIVRVQEDQNEVTISELEPDHRYKMNLYGYHDGRRVGPVSVTGKTAPHEEETPIPTVPATEAPEPPEKPELGELTVTGATPDSLKLSWTISQGEFDYFTIQYKDTNGRPQIVRVQEDQNEVTISELEPDHRYKMNLYGFYNGQRVGPVSVTGKTVPHEEETPAPTMPATEAPEPPEKPELGELTVTDATPDSLKLSWTISQGEFDYFTIQYKDTDGRPQIVRVGGDQNEVTISELEPDHRYKMNLYGYHDGQRVGPVSVTGKTVPHEEETPAPTMPATEAPEPPEKPELGELTVTDATPDSLKLSWTISQGEFDYFTIQYKDTDGRPQIVRVGGDQNEVTISELEPDHRYKMNLYGYHDGQRVGPVSATGKTVPEEETPTSAVLTTESSKEIAEPQLGELTVTEITSDSLHLTWTVTEGQFDSFMVQYENGDGQSKVVHTESNENEIMLSGLDPNHEYELNLFGFHKDLRVGPVSTFAVTAPEATEPPAEPYLGELTVTDISQDSLHLTWNVLQGPFDSFVIQYKDRGGQPQVVPVAGDQSGVTLSGLEPSRKYKFLLFGLHNRKRSAPVSAEAKTLPAVKPSPLLGEMKVTDPTPDSLHLSWTILQGPFDSFVVQYKDKDGQPRVVPVGKDQREIIISNLEPNRKYKFLLYGLFGKKRLGPVSADGTTAQEEETATVVPATEAPEPPSGPRLGILEVTDVAPDSLGLSWTVLQGPFNSFVIQYKDKDGKSQAVLVRGDQKKITISDLEPNWKYTFLLYGLYDGKRLGPISTEGTTGLAPAPPGDTGGRLSQLSVSDVTTSSFRLNWEAPPGAFDSFLLRYGVPEMKPSEPLYPPLLQRQLTVPGIQRSAVLRDLRPGTLYAVTLYGLRGPRKADSLQGTARTLSPVLESPRDLKFSEIQENSAKVSWTPPPNRVDGFKISYQLADGGEPQSIQVDGHTWHQHLVGLTPGTRYEVTVVSVRGFEESEPLTGFLTTVPDGPTQLRALNVTDDSALLHWSPPQAPVERYALRVTAPEVPPVMASVPGSAVDFPLHNLQPRKNYTATLRGFRGPNITSPGSITFTTGLDAPRDLKAKEITPRSALLTWTEPESPLSGYLLSYDTPGGQTQEILLPGGVTSHQLSGLFPSTLYNARIQAVRGESLTPPVPTTFTTGGLRIPFPRDCGEEMQNGISNSRTTTIFLNGNRERPLEVYCDMETDGGGWLVFQRRMDGRTDFWRDWAEYARGFGDISGEFWLGNEALHSLTQAGDYSMRVDLRTSNESAFAEYDFFTVDSAAKYYRLHLEGYHGTAGDSMSYHSGSIFSTRDRDPNNLHIPCAVSYRGGWWYRNCHYANLNGLYGSIIDHQGVSWHSWKGFEVSIPFTEMKLRPRSYNLSSQRA
ncbi:tenascin-X isoform X3 [Notamacropus eugenii]|uniref:tenascin-X isoform X3 n=1 Tax=Notamacropus eugenii TaxID=9315 RepID=UPI003B66B506